MGTPNVMRGDNGTPRDTEGVWLRRKQEGLQQRGCPGSSVERCEGQKEARRPGSKEADATE